MKRLSLALGLFAAAAACTSPDPDVSLRRGQEALEAGRPRTARIEFMNVLQAQPDRRDARLLQARALLAIGDGAGAQAELARARQLGAPLADLYHLMAHALLLQGDHAGAIREADLAPAAHRVYADRIAGRALLAAGDTPAAAARLAGARDAAPTDSRVWTDLARLHRSTGDMAAANAAADRAVALDGRDVEALSLRGELTRRQYGLAAALPWFDRALAIDPGHVPTLLERAITYGDLGRMRDMLADTRAALSLTGGHPVAYYLQAMLAARARDYPLARSLYARTGGAFDDQPAGMLLASAIDFETGNVEQAAVRLRRLVAMQPGNRTARRLLAAAQWRKGDAAGVAETLRPVADRLDADSYVLSLMGQAVARTGDRAASAHYLARAAQPGQGVIGAPVQLSDGEFLTLQQAARERPGDGLTQARYIAALIGRGQSEEALGRARRLQAENPGAPEGHMLVGDALGIRGDFRGAAEQYRRAANLAFTEPVALRLIEALRRSGQDAGADQVLELFVQQNPRNVPATVMYAARALEQERWDDAIRLYEGLRARIGDRDATVLNNLAWAYSEAGDMAAAVPLARRAWRLDPDNPATTDTLGWLLFKSGQRAEGLALLERAARGAPTDTDIQRRLDQARRG